MTILRVTDPDTLITTETRFRTTFEARVFGTLALHNGLAVEIMEV